MPLWTLTFDISEVIDKFNFNPKEFLKELKDDKYFPAKNNKGISRIS